MRFIIPATILLLMLVLPGFGPAAAQSPDDAVFNGGFEIAAHQARPAMCEVFGDGYINVFDPGNPAGLPWVTSVSPCQSSTFKAAGWSSGMTSEVADFDGDGDREIKFLPGTTDPNIGGGHNLWQAYPNSHQAYTANFERLEITVEDGTVPSNALIQLSLSVSPIHDVNPYVVLFIDCGLNFRGALLQPDANGTISIDPTYGQFFSRYAGDELSRGCDELAAEWNAAEPGSEERRDVLDGVRLVQHSYWSWNSGTEPVVIDDITMVGSRTAVDSLLS